MKNNLKPLFFIAALAFGSVWNVLCLTGVRPLSQWPFSNGVVGLASLVMLVPGILQQKQEEGRQKPGRASAALMLTLFFAWAVTVIVCLVDPL